MHWLTVPLLMLLAASAWGGTFPATSDPTLADQQRWGAMQQGYVADGCWHGTSASTSVALPSCRAFALDTTGPARLQGFEDTTPRTLTYSAGDGTYWLGGRANPSTPMPGWTCSSGLHYCWIKAEAPPVVPSGLLRLGQVTVSTNAITAFAIMAPWQRTTPYSVPLGTTLTFGACPQAGRWQILDADRVTTGAVEFAGGACREYMPEWFGIAPDGVDHSLKWAAFFASVAVAEMANVPAYQSMVTVTPGVYPISGNPAVPIPAGVDVHAYGVMFDYGAGTGIAVQIGDAVAVGIGGVVQGFSVRRAFTDSGAMATQLLGTGIYFVNVSNAVLRDFVVTGFATGLHVTGLTQACAYNTIQPRQLHNNLVGLWADNSTGTGFTNEVNVYGGRWSTTGTWSNTTGSRFIWLNGVDDWRFYGPNLEGVNIERKLLVDSAANFNVVYWARWEGTPSSGVEIEMTTGTSGNLIFQGDAFTGSLADTTVVDAGTRNTFLGSIQWRLLSNRTHLGEGQNLLIGTNTDANDAAVRIGNSSGGTFPALGVFTGAGVTWAIAPTNGTMAWLDTPGGTVDTTLERSSAGSLHVNHTLLATSTITSLGGIVGLGGDHVIRKGTGSPEGAITADVGSLFLRTDGGASTTLYVKQSGSGNTGWAAK